jgi:hypothetical protein
LREVKVDGAAATYRFRTSWRHTMSKLNVGGIDRALRMILGLSLILLAAAGVIGAWDYVGVIPLLTGAVAFCPLYGLLGISTTSR